LLLGAFSASAEPLRIATWHMELERRGPGLLLRDILRDKDSGIAAVARTIAITDPDVLLITGFDWDLGLAALTAFADRLKAEGVAYPHLFALRPNNGMATGIDMDGDGRLGGPTDAQGFGRFAGNGGMALLSRLPIDRAAVRDFSVMLWADLPGALMPEVDGKPFPSAEAQRIQRLSSAGHWDVPLITADDTRLHLLAFAAGTPVFDGPEDRNGRRNHDEVTFWSLYLNSQLAQKPPTDPVILLGNANLDPVDGEGRRDALHTLLANPRLQDPQPTSSGAAEAARTQGGANVRQSGNPALDTADWRDTPGPGNLRISYVLPDKRLKVLDAGVFWPARSDPLYALTTAKGSPRHHLVWVDIELPH
jgi:hypothetical protein